jgi:hypothetical protein
MPRTPDRTPGESLEEGTVYDNRPPGEEPTSAGGVRYVDGSFSFRDSLGLFNPRSGGSGITEPQHKALDTLVHDLAEDNYTELTYTGQDLTSVIVWETAAKLKKIREATLSYTGDDLTQVIEKQYDAAGTTVVEEITSTLAYSSGDLISVTEDFT